MNRLPILNADGAPVAEQDEDFLGQPREISTHEFLTALLEDRREDVAKMIVQDDRLVHSRDTAGASAVLLAVYHGLDEMLGILRRSEVPLDLPEAAAVGDLDRVAEVIASGAEAAAPSGDGFPPLVLAATYGREDVVRHLLEAGAPASQAAINPTLTTPLHGAAGHADAAASESMVAALLGAGADVDAEQAGGFTPLHHAAGKGHGKVVRRLLDAGAKPAPESDLGLTPYALAEQRGHLAVMSLLPS